MRYYSDVSRRNANYRRVYRWNSGKCFSNILLLLLAVGVLLVLFSTKTKADQTPQSIIIRNGDTLWNIAQNTRPEQDPRLTVESIRDTNHLKSVIVQPGQKIVVP